MGVNGKARVHVSGQTGMSVLRILVELTFIGIRVGCWTLRGDSSEPIEAFHGSGNTDYYPRNISILQGSGPQQSQGLDVREPRTLSGRRGAAVSPLAGRNGAHGLETGFTV